MSKTNKSSSDTNKNGPERRRTRRRPILDTFSMFCVVPKKGAYHRLPVLDVSEQGIGFDLDTEGEDQSFSIKSGEQLEVHFYLNQSLYLPLTVKVVRIEERNQLRRIGAELESKGAGHHAFSAFIQMLDAISDVAQIRPY